MTDFKVLSYTQSGKISKHFQSLLFIKNKGYPVRNPAKSKLENWIVSQVEKVESMLPFILVI